MAIESEYINHDFVNMRRRDSGGSIVKSSRDRVQLSTQGRMLVPFLLLYIPLQLPAFLNDKLQAYMSQIS
jgi:hypothetical protein